MYTLQDIVNKPREDNIGIEIHVNEKIKESCTKLMETVSSLILTSKFLQAEIVSQGKVCNVNFQPTSSNFYHFHSLSNHL